MITWQFWTIAGVLIVIALLLVDRRRSIVIDIDEAIARLSQESQHFVQVNAVLALVEQFEERPELMANLQDYSRQVVAAALLARVNAIGNDIKVVQKELSYCEKAVAEGYALSYGDRLNLNSARLTELYKKLEVADKAAQNYRSLRAI